MTQVLLPIVKYTIDGKEVVEESTYWRKHPEEIALGWVKTWGNNLEKDIHLYQIWDESYSPLTQARKKRIYKWIAKTQVDEKSIRLRASIAWGKRLRKALDDRGITDEIPSHPDHRETIEWLRQKHPIIQPPDFLKQYFLLLVQSYINKLERV